MDILNKLEAGFKNQSTIEDKLFDVQLEQLVPTKEGFEVPTAFGVYKSTGGQPLGVVGKTYVPTQPRALYEGLLDCDIDMANASFNTYKDGARCYFDIPIERLSFKNNMGIADETDVSIRLNTGFDGKTKTTFNVHTHRLICSNGMKVTTTEFSMGFKNTTGNQGKALSICHDVSRILETITDVKQLYVDLDSIQINGNIVDKYLARVMDIDKALRSEWTTKKTNIYNNVMGSIQTEFERTGTTAFGLLQGITHYTNHVASVSGSDDYLLGGTGGKTNDKALKFLTELI